MRSAIRDAEAKRAAGECSGPCRHRRQVRVVAPSFFEEGPAPDAGGDCFGPLIAAIQDESGPEKIGSEEHLQPRLAVFLKAGYPGRRIGRGARPGRATGQACWPAARTRSR